MATVARIAPQPVQDDVMIRLNSFEVQELARVLYSKADVSECRTLREALRQASLYPPKVFGGVL